ncbi:unnamed protein product [Closterium sp. NIES-54]
MAATRLLRFDAKGRALEFPSWLIRAERFLKSQRQDNYTLWAHASSDLPEPPPAAALGAEPDEAAQARFDKAHTARSVWQSRDAAACIALASLLPDTEEAHFSQHPSALTIDVLETALLDIESNIRSVASASGAVVPPLFQGCTVPQLPTFTASLASIASPATGKTVAVSTAGGHSRGKGCKRGGKGGGGGGGGGGGKGPGATSASGGGNIGGGIGPAGPTGGGPGAAVWYTAWQRQQSQEQ